MRVCAPRATSASPDCVLSRGPHRSIPVSQTAACVVGWPLPASTGPLVHPPPPAESPGAGRGGRGALVNVVGLRK